MSIRIQNCALALLALCLFLLMGSHTVRAAGQCDNGWEEIYTDIGVFSHCAPPAGGATTNTGGATTNTGGATTNTGGATTNPGGTTRVMSLINPIKCSPAAEQKGECLIEFLLAIISVLLLFALPIIIFFIMYAGFQFVTAAGNESKVSAAKSTLLWAVIGGVIILGSKLIITVIQGTITAFGQ